MCNLIKEIESVRKRELNVHWEPRGDIAYFDWALELAQLIRESNETEMVELKKITNIISNLGNAYGLRVLHRHSGDGSWRS